jgi:hypothetical protein
MKNTRQTSSSARDECDNAFVRVSRPCQNSKRGPRLLPHFRKPTPYSSEFAIDPLADRCVLGAAARTLGSSRRSARSCFLSKPPEKFTTKSDTLVIFLPHPVKASKRSIFP